MSYQDFNSSVGKNFGLEIGKGNIPGHSFMQKFGENPEIPNTGVFEDVWDGGGTYVPPTQTRLHNVTSNDAADQGTVRSSGTATSGTITTLVDTGATFVSDSVAVGDLVLNDTNVEIGLVTALSETTLTIAGSMRSPNDGGLGNFNLPGQSYRIVSNASTGASVMHILGQGTSRLEQNEFVVLNGTSNVATSLSYLRQYRARVFGPSTPGAQGVLTSTAQSDGTVSCQIIDGNNQTLMAVYSVPSNKNGHLCCWWGTLSKAVASAVCDFHIRSGTLGGIGYLLQTRTIDKSGSSDFKYNWSDTAMPLVPGGTDIWMEANSNANSTAVAGGFDMILEDA